VLRRVLSAEEIGTLANGGTADDFFGEGDEGVLLAFENEDDPLADQLADENDAGQVVTAPVASPPGEVELLVNFSTSAAGSLRCEIQDADGSPIPGFTLADSDELYGDSLDRAMSWKGIRELKSLAGRPVRLRFELRDADLYALRFGR